MLFFQVRLRRRYFTNVVCLFQDRLEQQAVNQPCMLVYTSGTTGDPKGVMISQVHLRNHWRPQGVMISQVHSGTTGDPKGVMLSQVQCTPQGPLETPKGHVITGTLRDHWGPQGGHDITCTLRDHWRPQGGHDITGTPQGPLGTQRGSWYHRYTSGTTGDPKGVMISQ